MKPSACLPFFLAVLCGAALGGRVGPIQKVLEMISDLQAKIIKDGVQAQAVYEEFSEWCEDRNRNLGNEIKTGKSEVDELKAVIGECDSSIDAFNTKIDELASSIATDEGELKASSKVRDAQAADFATEEKDLLEVIDTLKRAIKILSKEGGPSMLQIQNANTLTDALSAMVEASVFSSADATKLAALAQISDQSQDQDSDTEGDADQAQSAPAVSAYEKQSGGIIATMKKLLEDAETALQTARDKETSSSNNFQMMKQSLENEIKFATRDMDEAKKSLAKTKEKKSTTEGDLTTTTKELDEDVRTMDELKHSCLAKAEEFEEETQSRNEELKALAAAKKAILDSTGGKDSETPVSLLQVSRAGRPHGVSGFKIVIFLREVAQRHSALELAQLASRMASTLRSSSKLNEDPFAKVRGLITDMLAKLQDEAAADARKKAYCDKEMAETKEKEEDKTAKVQKLSTVIDQMTSRFSKLKEQIAALQESLGKLAESQDKMDKLRQEEHDNFVAEKAVNDEGLEGIKLSLKILRKYYSVEDKAHNAAEGAGAGIIGLLEVIESDFAKTLAELIAEEEAAQKTYEQETNENEIEKRVKETEVKHKGNKAAGLKKAIAESKGDRKQVQAALDAVLEYLEKIETECVAKAETYDERKSRREAELEGLREALSMLEGPTSLLETSVGRALRGVRPHADAFA